MARRAAATAAAVASACTLALLAAPAPRAAAAGNGAATGGENPAAQAVASAEPALRLSLPVACEPGKTCFVQNLVDHDPGPAGVDHRCGTATYDGHNGIDIRLLSAAAARAGVAALAAADGVVERLRADMADNLLGDRGGLEAGRRALAGRECGNGVLIDHGGGWQTQYCHMRQGSIAVRPGERVARGQKLGEIGYSGLVQFAHLHLTVRRLGRIVDPYTGREVGEPCRPGDGATPAAEGSLWDERAAAALAYRNGEIVGAGFASAPVSTMQLEADHDSAAPPAPAAPALLVYARLANLRQDDRVRITVNGPAGFAVDETGSPLDRNKAMYVAFAGKRLVAPRWPPGRYQGRVELLREGTVIDARVLDGFVMP